MRYENTNDLARRYPAFSNVSRAAKHLPGTCLINRNKGHGPKGSMTTRLIALAREAGPAGLFAGLGPRMSESFWIIQNC